MIHYYIDAENVHNGWMELLKEENADFKVFYSNVNKGLSYDDLAVVIDNFNRISLVKCYNGTQNAVDFQLISTLGYDLKDSPSDDQYVVFSNDKGYDCVVRFWKDRNFDVIRKTREALKQEHALKNFEILKSVEKTNDEHKTPETVIASDNGSENDLKLLSYIGKKRLPECNQILLAIYGNEEGAKRYNALKKDIPAKIEAPIADKIHLYMSLLIANKTDVILGEDSDKFAENLIKKKPLKLTSYKQMLQSIYGKEKSEKIYSQSKSVIKPAFALYK